MTLDVHKTAAAIRDLIEHATYLEEQSSKAAERFLDAVEESIRRLADMPEIGSVYETENSRLAGLRAWGVKGFDKLVIFYRIDVNRIKPRVASVPSWRAGIRCPALRLATQSRRPDRCASPRPARRRPALAPARRPSAGPRTL